MNDNNNFGFIILRHVNSGITNMYWQESYDSIRKFYPENKIVIIDDNSNYKYVTNKPTINTTVVQSEFPGRGELLPYYYYSKNKWFDTAVILHDSAFLNKAIDTKIDKYKLIWNFEHNWDQVHDEINMIKLLKNNENLLQLYKNKNLWTGCFGSMAIVKHEYLEAIDGNHNLANLLKHVTTRYNRCSFERVIACLLQENYKPANMVLLGNIHRYCKWGITYNEYLNAKKNNGVHLPIVKVWTGR
jgi:hypothetical protein